MNCLIGAGRWGKNLARNLFSLGQLHTLVETDQTLLKTYEGLYPGVRLSHTIDLPLQDEGISSVMIATPAATHYHLAKKALLAKKDVFVEKPLSLSLAEAKELVNLARELGQILMVGHLLNYHPCIERLKEEVKEGRIGRLLTMSSNRLSFGTIRTEENALFSFSPHDISIVLSLFGEKPTEVLATGGAFLSPHVHDHVMTTLKFEGDRSAFIHASWLHPFKEHKMVVTGSEGFLVFDDTLSWEQKLIFYPHKISWREGKVPIAQASEGHYLNVSQKEPLKEEILHFLTCCQTRMSPKTDGEEGLNVLEVLTASQEALLKSHPVSLSKQSFFAHPTAVIDPGASIAPKCSIWHFSHIMGGATLDEGCNIGQNVVVSPKVVLGKNVKVQNNVSLYTGVLCEDDVFVGPSVVFTNVINPRSHINRKAEFRNTYVRKGATIGANATIVCGVELGEYCFVGAGSVVTKDVLPHQLVVGNPAKPIGWVSSAGVRLSLPPSIPQGQEEAATCSSSNETYLLKDGKLHSLQVHFDQTEKTAISTLNAL